MYEFSLKKNYAKFKCFLILILVPLIRAAGYNFWFGY